MAEKPIIKEKTARIVWGSDEDLPAYYANHMYISHAGETEFHLIFGHLSPPLTINLEEDELPDYVTIKPVAKLVMSSDVMRSFVRLLVDNLERFEEKQKGKKND